MWETLIKTILWAVCLSSVHSQDRTVENSCPQELIDADLSPYLQVANERCYYFVVYGDKDFDDSNNDCKNYGGYLAMPKEEYLNDYLAETLYNIYSEYAPIWIGLHDGDDEDVFQWVDGTKMTWDNFAEGNGEDNNWLFGAFEDCVTIYPETGEWHDYQCEDDWVAWLSGSDPTKPYVCEYPATPLPDVTEAPADVTEVPADVTEAPVDVTEASADVTECPGFDCPDLDCGMVGYAVDENSCQLCECFFG